MSADAAAPGAAPAPALSVIVVNYNAGDLLADCVAAVLTSAVAVEVIVSDNGSTDASLTLVRERLARAGPRLRILENGANLGFARGNNLGLAHASAPYLLFLNPDCVVARSPARGGDRH